MNSSQSIILKIISLFIFACSNGDINEEAVAPEQIQLKVIGRGTSVGQPKTIVHPTTGENLRPNCFLMDLVHPETGAIMGTLQDCIVDMHIPSDGTITSTVITSINIHGRGTIQAENIVFHEIRPPVNELNFDTSFIPIENNVIDTTHEFENMEGTVSLEGEVSFAEFDKGILIFNSLFTINLQSD
ncbi:hypothetical protein KIM67_00775 [Flagellimonas sp. 389]|uniref:hypothetical protein n=1 Tax=Flagellimonas sp. 389 TaxID=2835862 RepID=UPI001BD58344|nr:hypothetical protein [Flagellimonas sp. 389]MBS9460924.1 hypothetical protein [Flagellimonas sp. 389]